MNDFPEELRQPVVPVVALIGHSSLHPSIEKNLSTKTHYDASIPLFRVVSIEIGSIPAKKEKRQGYEQYVPQGVLKSNWMHKHKHVLPAVLVLLFSWGDNENVASSPSTISSSSSSSTLSPSTVNMSAKTTSDWRAREADICTQVEIARFNAKSRNIKILVALVQSQSIGTSFFVALPFLFLLVSFFLYLSVSFCFFLFLSVSFCFFLFLSVSFSFSLSFLCSSYFSCFSLFYFI
jgi:hypothetical protein